jgi:hypothetical protein
MQRDLTALQHVQAHVLATRSRHLIPRDEPELVARELLTVVTATREAGANQQA